VGTDGELGDTTKRLMSSSKCRSVEVINNSTRPKSNHRDVNYIIIIVVVIVITIIIIIIIIIIS
jgi:hypothetical protein